MSGTDIVYVVIVLAGFFTTGYIWKKYQERKQEFEKNNVMAQLIHNNNESMVQALDIFSRNNTALPGLLKKADKEDVMYYPSSSGVEEMPVAECRKTLNLQFENLP